MASVDNCFIAMDLHNLSQAYLSEVGVTQIPNHAPLSTTYHVGLHVDFSSTNIFSFSYGPLGFTS